MIESASFVLDWNYIYTNVATYETELICLPLVRETGKKLDFASFSRVLHSVRKQSLRKF